MRKLGYLVALTLVFAGCGSDDDDSGSKGTGGSSSGGTSSGGTGGTSSGGTGGTSTGGTSSGGTAGTATGGSAGTATGGTAGTASGGSAGTASGGSAGKPSTDAGTGGKPNDGGTGPACNTTAQCKKFSSYCANAACQCIPLGINDPDPKCEGGQVTCIVDPCLNKQIACINGACVFAP